MHHLLYKTVNLVNGKFYIGVHSTKNPSDRYLGSGRRLLRAIREHGRESFKREILGVFDSREEAFAAERAYLQPHAGKGHCYNVAQGGLGGKTRTAPWNKGLKTGPLGRPIWNKNVKTGPRGPHRNPRKKKHQA